MQLQKIGPIIFLILQHALTKRTSNRFGINYMKGSTLRFSIPPRILSYFSSKLSPVTGLFEFQGPIYNLIDHSSRKFNYSYKIQVAEEGFGIKLQNGTWTGTIGALMKGDANVIIAARTLERNKIMDFTIPYAYIRLFFWTRRNYNKNNSLLGSYQSSTWILVLLAFSLITLLFYLNYKRVYRFQRVLVMVFALALEEAVPIPRILWDKIRFTTWIWLTFVLVISTGYKSQLIASLTRPGSLGYVPETFAELASRPEYKINFHHLNGAALSFFSNNSLPVVVALRRRLVVKPVLDCLTEAFCIERTACLTWDFMASSFMASNLGLSPNSDREMFYRTPEALYWATISIVFKRGSKWVRPFNFILYSYTETGLISKWIRDSHLTDRIEASKTLLTNNFKSRISPPKVLYCPFLI